MDAQVSSFDNKYHPAPSLSDVASGKAQLGIGDQGDSVKALQRQLGVKADGFFGPITMRALAAAQQSSGTPAANLGRAGKRDLQQLRVPTREETPAADGPTPSGDTVTGTAAMERLAANARTVALGMGGYRGRGRCATGVSETIRRSLGISVSGNGNQIDNNLPRDKFQIGRAHV